MRRVFWFAWKAVFSELRARGEFPLVKDGVDGEFVALIAGVRRAPAREGRESTARLWPSLRARGWASFREGARESCLMPYLLRSFSCIGS